MQNDNILIAHKDDAGNIQTIKEHLHGTAKMAEGFASEFGCGELGFLCGLLHDIGKYSETFQRRIRNPLPSNRVDHSTAGFLWGLSFYCRRRRSPCGGRELKF